ncbi:L-rhamnose mutarotase [candidate division KSB1 bacterium]|nr:L-rhamnose mutarotase [candidate division KSB1 bacterium]
MEEVFYFNGKANSGIDESKVQRIGMVIGLQPEMKEAYVLLHKNIWPEVQSKITEGNIRNYAIYLHELDCKFYLFSYFEYVGNNFPADMELIDNDPATIAWMKFTDTGCQLPISTRSEGEWWAAMEQVFYSK